MTKKNNENAVSPVIGVILMVAITVILAAVIASFVFGMSGNIQRTKLVGVSVERMNSTHVSITFYGGADAATLLSVCWTVDGVNRAMQVNADHPLTQPIPLGTNSIIPAIYPSKNHIVGIGTFADGSNQVIFDTIL